MFLLLGFLLVAIHWASREYFSSVLSQTLTSTVVDGFVTSKFQVRGYLAKQPNLKTDFPGCHQQFSRSEVISSLRMSTTDTYFAGMDAYQILGVTKNADAKEIKSAYRKLIAQWHPDKFPDDEEKKKEGGIRMEKINRAYYVLSDEDRRRRYDRYGEQGVGTSAASEEQLKNAGGPGMGGFGGADGSVDVGDISDIFDAFFGNAGGRPRGSRQQSVNAPLAGSYVQLCVASSIYPYQICQEKTFKSMLKSLL